MGVDQVAEAQKLKTEGNAFFREQNFPKALECYSKAIELDPKGVYYTNRSVAHVKLNNIQQALKDAHMSIEIDPGFNRGYEKSGDYHIRLGQLAEAQDVINKGLARFPESKNLNRKNDQLKYIDNVLNAYKKAYRNCDFKRALVKLQALMNECTKDQTMMFQKIDLLLYDKQLKEAIKYIRKQKKAFEEVSKITYFVQLSRIFRFQDDLNKSLIALKNARKLEKNDPTLKRLIKDTKGLIKKINKAEKALDEGNFKEAKELFQKLKEMDPMNRLINAKFWFKIGLCEKGLGENDAAYEAFNQAAFNQPSAEIFHEKAKTEIIQGNMDRASVSLKIVSNLEPMRNLEKEHELIKAGP